MNIDLERHGVIEASAGTGKTHTLQELVLRLLQEGKARLEEILLVTFTEKATGELKARLREALEQSCRAGLEQRQRFQAALDAFDQAQVYTIHAFCQRALQEYALENRHEQHLQLINDRDLLEPCLREIQRRHWREQYGERMRDVLELAGYNGPTGGAETWEKLVQDLALRYRPGCKHLLRPECRDDWQALVEQREKNILASLHRWRELAGPFPSDNVEDHPWSIGFRQLEESPRTREPRHDKLLLPLLRLLAGSTDQQSPAAFQRFLEFSKKASSFDKHGFFLLSDALLSEKARGQLEGLCPNLGQVVKELEALRQDASAIALRHQLSVRTVLELQKFLAEHKSERGLQSFDDMLTGLAASLDPLQNPHAEALCDCLRRKFRYAIVDEFQDTDPIQWDIFKRIFVTGAPAHRLFVVGDPKQAIFGFRGADVHAYQVAREELTRNFQAASYPLDVNWRSCPDLIAALNGLFQKGDWFKGTGIDVAAVRPPPAEQQRYRLVTDQTGRPALCAVDLRAAEKLVQARRQNAFFIAAEICRLLAGAGGRPAMEVQRADEEPRPLNAGDCCILVSRRREAQPICMALQDRNIPYSFYKQPGLWQSPEAIHLDYLLRALGRPDDPRAFHKALLTRFFRIRPDQLSACEQLPPRHDVRAFFDRWLELAEKRDWAQLFQAIGRDTGVLFHDLEQPDGERRLANFRLILQTLAQAAYAQDLDLLGILELLRDKRRSSEDDNNIQPVETEQPRVQIMTLHASKGLEFPVVFLAGGFTQGRSNGCLTYRQDGQLVFDLCPDEEAKLLAKRDQEHDERRLFYVALTRAIFKLYVPSLAADGKYGQKPALVSIVAPALDAADVETIPAVSAPVPSLSPQPAAPAPAPPRVLTGSEMFPRLPSDLSKRLITLRSFSSLHRQAVFQPEQAPSFAAEPTRSDDERPDALPAENSVRGPGFGSLVHDVLEEICFAEVGAAAGPDTLLQEGTSSCLLIDRRVEWYLPEVSSRLHGDALRSACRQQVAELVWKTLHTPLRALGGPLWQIPEQDRLQELEFHFPERQGSPPAEITRSEGFYTGFIDLVFRKCNQYYLVDWKTNALTAYAPQDIARSMRESAYHAQYELYLQALMRWLKRAHGGAFDFARDFGGVYYLYLRGMNGKDETTGVFFHRPSGDAQLDLHAGATA
ncbi:MAG TPA: UvrD-helicase domain-containing protein [Gemmataceae bacterium]|nr:UvrD-helicase domain-containing protein [Gemmataceae bacterium]